MPGTRQTRQGLGNGRLVVQHDHGIWLGVPAGGTQSLDQGRAGGVLSLPPPPAAERFEQVTTTASWAAAASSPRCLPTRTRCGRPPFPAGPRAR